MARVVLSRTFMVPRSLSALRLLLVSAGAARAAGAVALALTFMALGVMTSSCASDVDGGQASASPDGVDGGADVEEPPPHTNVDGGLDGGDDGGAATPKGPRTTPVLPLAASGFYPRVIRRANGRILASIVAGQPGGRLGGSIFESTDEGVTFTLVGRIDDPIAKGGLCCSTLYELPRALGSLPAGTLLWSASIGGDTPGAPMSLPVWKSVDDGRTWTFLSKVVTAGVARSSGGLWEPELSMLDDGTLVCHFSDETDPAHSQKLVEMTTRDGLTWSGARPTVALAPVGYRPGMPNVRRTLAGNFLLSYEICGVPGDSCTAWVRASNNGLDWGDPANAGTRVVTVDGKHLRHAPTLDFSAAPGDKGRFFMIGQMTFAADGSVAAAENGSVVFVSSENGARPWYTVPAPIAIPTAYDNFCPNYSSSLLPVDDGTVGLEIASRYDGSVCRPYFARGPLIDTSDGSEIVSGSKHRLVSNMSALCLDVANGSKVAGATVQQYTCNGSASQSWKIARASDGTMSLAADVSGMCLTVANGATKPGVAVVQQPCDGSAAQAWTLRTMGLGYYALKHAGTTSCLDVAAGSIAPGGVIQQWTCNDLAPQIWHFE